MVKLAKCRDTLKSNETAKFNRLLAEGRINKEKVDGRCR